MTRRSAVIAALICGGLALLALGQTWVTAGGLQSGPVAGAVADVEVTGNDAAPVAAAMAVVIVVAALALTIARRLGRWIVGGLLAVAGATVTASSLTVVASPGQAASRMVSEATGTTAAAPDHAVTAWPWLAAAAGALSVVVALLVLTVGRRWANSRRYQAPSGDRPVEAGPGRSRAGQATDARGRTGAPEHDADDESDLDEMDAWDSLSRGEDPTA